MPPKPEDDNLQPIAEIDRTIHAPARLMIMAVLAVVESAEFLFIMHQTGLTRGNLSSHLSKLESSGYIEVKKEFVDKIPRTLLRLTDKGLKAIRAYRQNMLQVLEEFPD